MACSKMGSLLLAWLLMKRILFITSANLAANPRLVKELMLARDAGFESTVLQFQMGNWSDALTQELQKNFPATEFILLSAHRKPFGLWLMSSVLQKLYSLLPASFLSAEKLSFAVSKRSWILLRKVKQIQNKYNWVIAHNPAAFYPAWYISQKKGIRLGIDVEDYHPGETTVKKQEMQMRLLMQKLLPAADYCSYAAPLIAEEVQQDIPGIRGRQIVVVNGFPAQEFIQPVVNTSAVLKMVWFSQNIDGGRGLEEVIIAVNQLYPAVELHLIGHLHPAFAREYLQNTTGIVIHEPMPQQQLHVFLAQFDIGLASDIPVNRNRELAITNKIIAYAQAGLYILCFPSKGQVDFLHQYQLYHTVTDNKCESVITFLQSFTPHTVDELKMQQYEKGLRLNWQELARPLAHIWECTNQNLKN